MKSASVLFSLGLLALVGCAEAEFPTSETAEPTEDLKTEPPTVETDLPDWGGTGVPDTGDTNGDTDSTDSDTDSTDSDTDATDSDTDATDSDTDPTDSDTDTEPVPEV